MQWARCSFRESMVRTVPVCGSYVAEAQRCRRCVAATSTMHVPTPARKHPCSIRTHKLTNSQTVTEENSSYCHLNCFRKRKGCHLWPWQTAIYSPFIFLCFCEIHSLSELMRDETGARKNKNPSYIPENRSAFSIFWNKNPKAKNAITPCGRARGDYIFKPLHLYLPSIWHVSSPSLSLSKILLYATSYWQWWRMKVYQTWSFEWIPFNGGGFFFHSFAVN